jgi:hypothetical protein
MRRRTTTCKQWVQAWHCRPAHVRRGMLLGYRDLQRCNFSKSPLCGQRTLAQVTSGMPETIHKCGDVHRRACVRMPDMARLKSADPQTSRFALIAFWDPRCDWRKSRYFDSRESRSLISLSSSSFCCAILSALRASSAAPDNAAACSMSCRILSRTIAMRSSSSGRDSGESELSSLIVFLQAK